MKIKSHRGIFWWISFGKCKKLTSVLISIKGKISRNRWQYCASFAPTNGLFTFLPDPPFFIPIKKAANEWSSSSMSITSTKSSARSRNRFGCRPSLNDVRDASFGVWWLCDVWLWWNQATPMRFRPISFCTLLLRLPLNMANHVTRSSQNFFKKFKNLTFSFDYNV